MLEGLVYGCNNGDQAKYLTPTKLMKNLDWMVDLERWKSCGRKLIS
jgi:hypothetical protein